MADVEITIKLPEELVERARQDGVPINDSSVAMMIEAELARAQSVKLLRDAMDKLEGSLTPDEIEAELATAKVDRLI